MSERIRYTSGQVCRITGATMRQLDTWCRLGLICPSRDDTDTTRTNQRHWTPGAVLCVALLRRISASGLAPRFLTGQLDDLHRATHANEVAFELRVDLSDISAALTPRQPVHDLDDARKRRTRTRQPASPPQLQDGEPTPDPEPLPPPQRTRKTRQPHRTRPTQAQGLAFGVGMMPTLGEPDLGGRMSMAGSVFMPVVHGPEA